MEYKDYYQILGVGRDASDEDIRRAYRRLARKYHPDVNPNNDEATEHFKEINEAHEVLSDPDKRRKYDQLGSQYFQYQQGGGDPGGFDWSQWFSGSQGYGSGRVRSEYVDLNDLFGSNDFSDFFQSIFGGAAAGGRAGRQQQSYQMKGRDIEQPVQITLEEAFTGTARIARMAGGRIEVKIPAGVQTGSRVRIAGKGEPGQNGGRAGDLFLLIEVQEHKAFRREGDDLHTKLAVPLYTLVLGGEEMVPTLKGRLSLRIPPETKAGRVFRLRGQGMPTLRDPNKRGDLFVEVQPVLPSDLTPKEKELFSQLAAMRS
jgi:curved DNA-binding protein